MSETTPVPEIPLERPDPKLIQELFDRDPLELSDKDLDIIIAEFRADRASYLQEAEVKAKKSKATAAAKLPTIPVSDQIDLEDLFGK